MSWYTYHASGFHFSCDDSKYSSSDDLKETFNQHLDLINASHNTSKLVEIVYGTKTSLSSHSTITVDVKIPQIYLTHGCERICFLQRFKQARDRSGFKASLYLNVSHDCLSVYMQTAKQTDMRHVDVSCVVNKLHNVFRIWRHHVSVAVANIIRKFARKDQIDSHYMAR